MRQLVVRAVCMIILSTSVGAEASKRVTEGTAPFGMDLSVAGAADSTGAWTLVVWTWVDPKGLQQGTANATIDVPDVGRGPSGKQLRLSFPLTRRELRSGLIEKLSPRGSQ